MVDTSPEALYFQSLRAEAEDYIKAQRPTPSSHVRKPSSSTDQIDQLIAENIDLKRIIAQLQSENACLRQQLAECMSPCSGETRGEELSPGELLHTAELLAAELEGNMTALATQHMNLQTILPVGFEESKKELAYTTLGEVCEELRNVRLEVDKHKTFIRRLKEALLQVVVERRRERAAYKQLKLEVQRLRKG